MADLEEFPTDVSFPVREDTHMTEEVEQRVEEEVIHEVVSPDQTWTNDETVNHVDANNIVEESSCEDEGMFLLDSEEEVKQQISMYEKNTGTHFIVLKKEKGYSQTEWKVKRLSWSLSAINSVPIKFDGIPFMYLGQVLLGCHHGRDKNIGNKKRYRETVALRSLDKEDTYKPSKRLLSPVTKKMDCPALISIKKIVKFPDFQISDHATPSTRKKQLRRVVSMMKQAPETMNAEIKFYLKLAPISHHENHPVGLEHTKRILTSKRKMIFEDIIVASKRISAFINMTPIHRSTTVDNLCGRKVAFKAEPFQKTGSFKIRGALNAILCLKEKQLLMNGVVTHSTGNHGQALAYAAQLTGTPCAVVVPRDTPSVKVEAIRKYGAEVFFSEPTQSSRINTCRKVQGDKGFHFVSPYDDHDVIAGQGTLGLELLKQCPDTQAILIPTGGGGLAAGVTMAAKSIREDVKIYCVEPKGKDLEKSLKAGRRMWPNPPQSLITVADAIRTQQLGKLTWPILREKAETDVFTVIDDDIVQAMKFTWTRLKILVEPTGAIGVAAVLSDKMKMLDPAIQNVAVVLSGGNVDIERLPWLQQSGPQQSGPQESGPQQRTIVL